MSKCEFIAAKKGHHATSEAQRVVGVSKSTWHRWQHAATNRAQRDQAEHQLVVRIRDVWNESGQAYGAPRIRDELRNKGIVVNHKRIRRLMQRHGITSCMPYRPPRTTQRGAGPVPEDLVQRKFYASEPNSIWVTDITYIRTAQGWLYLVAFMDLYSRKVVGSATGKRCSTKLVLQALNNAMKSRKPGRGLIIHSDRGCQYTSRAFQKALRLAGIRQSMGRTGTCYDNAAAESLWASLKKERIGRWLWLTRAAATREITSYITWYNSRRLHSTLGNLAPAVFEARAA
jgi:putative transposase